MLSRVLRLSARVSRFLKNEYVAQAPAGPTAVKNTLGYITRNGIFKGLEPHFRLLATGSASKEATETGVALPHSSGCAKGPICALQKYGSKGTFRARAQVQKILQEKLRGRGASSRFDFLQKLFLWAMQRRCRCESRVLGETRQCAPGRKPAELHGAKSR